MTGMIETGCPVHIIQGMEDPDVPYSHALRLIEHLPADDVVLTLVRDGDHRLSRPQDISLLLNARRPDAARLTKMQHLSTSPVTIFPTRPVCLLT